MGTNNVNKTGSGTRINKYLASCGVCSRRDADKLIEAGAVTINGKIAGFGDVITGKARVCVNGKAVVPADKKVVLAYYKPVGITCTEKDAHAEKIVTNEIKYPVRVTYAGRLDRESEGLLIMTNDGDLIHAMMQGAAQHEKEYVVKVNKEISDDFLNRMSLGVFLPELGKTTRECEVSRIGKYTFRIVLTQGLNRQIRRMCKELGYRVETLKRVRVLNIELEKLHPGQYREISGEELTKLYAICGM